MARRSRILPAGILEYRCFKCGKREEKADNFYKSRSEIYRNNGCMPICKDCLAAMYNTYLLKYRDVYKAIHRLCMAFDLYYDPVIVSRCIESQDTTPPIGDYMRRLNTKQYKGKCYDETIEKMFLLEDSMEIRSSKSFTGVEDVNMDDEDYNPEDYVVTTIPETVRQRWGYGFSDSDYKSLEEHYKFLKKANPDVDSNQEIFIMDLCKIEMLKSKALKSERVDDYAKLTETYRKTFAQAGLKTSIDTSENKDDSWGKWTGIVSKYTPEEFYKDKDLYKNFGNMRDYFKRFLLRPLKNLQFGTTDRDEEFCVKDEET